MELAYGYRYYVRQSITGESHKGGKNDLLTARTWKVTSEAINGVPVTGQNKTDKLEFTNKGRVTYTDVSGYTATHDWKLLSGSSPARTFNGVHKDVLIPPPPAPYIYSPSHPWREDYSSCYALLHYGRNDYHRQW